MAAKKKKAAKASAKKVAKKKATKKKAKASTPKVAAKRLKKAAAKKAPAKKAAAKKAAPAKKAPAAKRKAPAKKQAKAAGVKSVKRRAVSKRKSASKRDTPLFDSPEYLEAPVPDEGDAPGSDEGDAPGSDEGDAPESNDISRGAAENRATENRDTDPRGGRPTGGGLRRGTRRQVGPRRTESGRTESGRTESGRTESGRTGSGRAASGRSGSERKKAPSGPRDIPPLPEEDDDFIPSAPAKRDKPTPAQLLERVRNGKAHISSLNRLTASDVMALASDAGLEPDAKDRTSDILYQLVNDAPPARRGGSRRERADRVERESVRVEGLLELHPDGYGFLRRSERNYSQHPEDVYVAAGLARKYQLKPGHWLTGQAHRPRPGQAYLALHEIEEVNHENPSMLTDMVPFKELTVVYPETRLQLETAPEDIEMRVMDVFCPLGQGQRALIVAPPRTGKTVLMTKLADAIATNSPNVDIVVLLVDERPEEVTNMRRSVRGEVIASTFDKPASNHVRVAELVMDKVQRMVEFGRDVVLLLDSITRLGRAYNNQTGGSGRILSGGLDANALSKPKRFFGSARNVEDGGSLTIVATALIDTGSKLDQVIFEEFKGTGNMEVVLSRDLANARVWPAIDVPASGTRNEDLLLHPDELQRVILLRRGITGQDPLTVMEALRAQMRKHSTNAQFLMGLGEGNS